jgi:CRISPR-associated protein Cas5d
VIFMMRVRGPLACFTRPEFKVERMSYEVITPSAARSIFEAILWKPAIRWQIHRIDVLSPIKWTSFRRNEVKSVASLGRDHIDPDACRAQRNTVALKDVDYVLTASFSLTDKAEERDNYPKFANMFRDRLEKGQQHAAPYLGCREFAARVEPAPEWYDTIDPGVDRPLGLMFYDFLYTDQTKPVPLFYEARMTDGAIEVPSFEDVLAENMKGLPGAEEPR